MNTSSSSPGNTPLLTHEQLAEQLINRGLLADKNELINRLTDVNYQRLSGYLYPFRETITLADGSLAKSKNYRPGTSLDIVWRYYLFDRRLRFLLMDAIERIEIALRSHIAYYWATATKRINPQSRTSSYQTAFLVGNSKRRLEKKLQTSYDQSILECVLHQKNKGIKCIDDLPIWVLLELTTIGELVWLFGGLKSTIRQDIAQKLGFPDLAFFDSVLSLIHQARNACAHHSRVWNVSWLQLHVNPRFVSKGRLLPIVKSLPPDWNLNWDSGLKAWVQHNGVSAVSKTSTAFLLLACSFLLKRVAHTSSWHTRFMELMSRPETPYQAMKEMGLPKNWREHPFFN